MRSFTLRSFIHLTVAAALSCAGLTGCGEDVVLPSVELINMSSKALNIGNVLTIGGQYQNCLQRSGPWFYALSGPPHPLTPSVVKYDAGCTLLLDGMNTQVNGAFAGTPIPMAQAYGAPQIYTSAGNSLFMNGRNDKAGVFDDNFNLQILYSDTLDAATSAPNSTSYSTVTSTYMGHIVQAPNLVLQQDIVMQLKNDSGKAIEAISGSARLASAAASPVDGKYYAVINGVLPNPTLVSLKSAFEGAAAKVNISQSPPPLMLGTFDLAVGSSLATAINRSVIVANFDASDTGLTTPSFQLFSFHFQAGCTSASDCGVSAPPEVEPNDLCTQANPGGALGAALGPLSLPNGTDVDWFVYQAAAADVGKVVHVVTSPGEPQTDTVVEAFDGTCAALNSLGGQSSDAGYHEDWHSTPITKAGMVFVKVSYSSFGFAGSAYNLTVTYE